MFLFSSRRTIPLNELPSGSLKPDILPVWPFCIKVSTCFWVSFLPCISIGIRKSQDFRYRVHPQAVFPFTISPCPHLGHFNTTAIFSPFSFFPFPFSLLYYGRRIAEKEPRTDKKCGRPRRCGDNPRFQIICHVAFLSHFQGVYRPLYGKFRLRSPSGIGGVRK